MKTHLIEQELTPTATVRDDEGSLAYSANARHNRTLKIGATALLFSLVAAVGGLVFVATRPPRVIVVRVDEVGHAEVIHTNTGTYIPQTPEVRTALFTWTLWRNRIVKPTATEDFKLSYYFLSAAMITKLGSADTEKVARIMAGTDPEQDVSFKRISVAPITVEKTGTDSIGYGTAQIEIEVRKCLDLPDGPNVPKERWLLDFRYTVNLNYAARRAEKEPNFQIYNPLGITITSFFATRELDGPEPTKQ